MKTLNVHPVITKFLESLDELQRLECSARHDYNLHHRQLVDVQHEVELSGIGYDDTMKVAVFNHLQEIAHNRRQAKDTILVLDMIKKMLQNGTQLEALSDVMKHVEEEWKRNYFPREIKTLDFTSEEALVSSRLEMLTNP
ncbi:hypothetical protein Arno162_112 [Pectobacterium phage Arno162]|uniref:Uncharacterized protein n=2 Tax=Arnovirus TaxID=3425109 RepID=A0A678ZNF1_9CAUD|nr:hypothetical protein Arno162_112 [Pectobacterium phage Arno162]AZV02299.1 hypothetical protein Arno18_112 [Pectobacterium phage Arno18]